MKNYHGKITSLLYLLTPAEPLPSYPNFDHLLIVIGHLLFTIPSFYHINYCADIWAACSKSSLKPFDILQHKALKIILKLPHHMLSADLYLKTKVLKPVELCQLYLIIFTHKLVHQLTPNQYESLNSNSLHYYPSALIISLLFASLHLNTHSHIKLPACGTSSQKQSDIVYLCLSSKAPLKSLLTTIY